MERNIGIDSLKSVIHAIDTAILKASRQAIKSSPPSTELLRFKKTIEHFLKLAYRS